VVGAQVFLLVVILWVSGIQSAMRGECLKQKASGAVYQFIGTSSQTGRGFGHCSAIWALMRVAI
jgi:hypothetical protein